MTIQVLMPALSPTMEEGTLSKWLIKEGDTVSPGQVIAEIETDKATMEVEAVDGGVVGKLFVSEGSAGVKVNTPIAGLLEDGETEVNMNAAPPAKARLSQDTTQPSSAQGQETSIRSAPAKSDHQATTHAEHYVFEPEFPEGTTFETKTVREAIREAMSEEMRANPNVFILGEEVAEYQGAYKVTQGMLDEFGPQRVVDTPIVEHGFTGLAVGAAFAGLRPIVEFMTFNFSMQAIDQIVNSASKTLYMTDGMVRCPIVFRGLNGLAARVAAQHTQDFGAWYAHVPGLKVVAPFTAADAKGLLKAAIKDDNPVIFLENELLYGQSFDVPTNITDFTIPIGKAKLVRTGSDVTLVSFGHAMTYCLEACEILSKEGIDVELIDLRSLRPLDIPAILASVRKTHRIVSVDENWPLCGIGSEIAAQIQQEAFDDLDAPVLRVTQKDVPTPYAANLETYSVPSTREVIEAVRAVCYKQEERT